MVRWFRSGSWRLVTDGEKRLSDLLREKLSPTYLVVQDMSGHTHPIWCSSNLVTSLLPFLPPSFPPFLPPSLFPSLPPSLPPFLPPFRPPFVPPSLRWMWCSIRYSHRLRRFQRKETCSAAQASDRSEPLELVVWRSLTIRATQLRQTIVLGGHSLSPLPLTCHFDPLCCVQALGDEMKTIHAVSIKIGNAE